MPPALPSHMLVIDVGNSRTKLARFVDGTLESQDSLASDKAHLESTEEALVALVGQPNLLASFDGIVVASVVPAITELLQGLLPQAIPSDRILWVDRDHIADLALGPLDISPYTDPLGADRLALALGATVRYPGQSTLVASFGTAATFDLIDEAGIYRGGAIAPGARLFAQTLNPDNTAQLSPVEVFAPPTETPGLSTSQSLANGTYYGYKGMILEILGNLLQNAMWPLSASNLVFTGGDGYEARQMLTLEIPKAHVDSDLLFFGLYQLWLLNRAGVAARP